MAKKQLLLMLAATLAGGFVGGLVSSQFFVEQPAYAERKVPEDIKAQAFKLVDKKGRTVGALRSRYRVPILWLKRGDSAIRLSFAKDGKPIISLSHEGEGIWQVPEETYQIVLKPDEKRELLSRTKDYTLPYFKVTRAKMILLAGQGLTDYEIAARMDTGQEIVRKWRERFYEQRLQGLEEPPKRARPQKQ